MARRSPAPAPLSPSAEIRGRIVTAARRIFLAHGFRGVTMGDLAAELGMSKKTLYAHFPSKADLTEAVLLDKLQSLEADVAEVAGTSPADFLHVLQRLLACLQKHADEIQPAFLRDLQRESPDLFRVVEQRRKDIIQRHFGQVLGAGRREGLIRRDVPVALIIEILLGAVQSVMNPPKLAEHGLTPSTGLTAILTVILEGVLTKPRKAKP